MTNKFSVAMQRLIVNAEQEAMKSGETQLSPAHLLIAIAEDSECTGAQALNALGISLDTLESELRNHISPCVPDGNSEFHMSPEGKQVINDALYVARTVGDGTILTIHVLIAIYSQVGAATATVQESSALVPANSVASATPTEILAGLGVTRERMWRLAHDYHRGLAAQHFPYMES